MVDRGDAAFVAFEHVQKSYDGETLVVKDLNLSIGKGEFLTMLGPSGSGKTTCLMMLAGFETATHGEIRLAGRPINNIPPHKRGIGMVFQNYALFPHMTVGENLAFPLQVRKIPKAEADAKVKRALDMVQMGRFATRRPARQVGFEAVEPGLGVLRPVVGDHRGDQRDVISMLAGADADLSAPLRVGELLVSDGVLLDPILRGVDDAGAAREAEPLVLVVAQRGRDRLGEHLGMHGLRHAGVDRLQQEARLVG